MIVALFLSAVLAVAPDGPNGPPAASVWVITDKKPATPPAKLKAAPTAVQTSTTGYRLPIGHTHTCKGGHTWDHTANPTHNCQFCGLYQAVQDVQPRLVTMTISPTHAPAPPAQPLSRTIRTLSGGCANGNCPVAR